MSEVLDLDKHYTYAVVKMLSDKLTLEMDKNLDLLRQNVELSRDNLRLMELVREQWDENRRMKNGA
jgi:hypothetical protein